MTETAAFLVDDVLPRAPYRQWTITFPKQIRFMLARDGKLLGAAIKIFLRAVFAWQRRRAKKIGIQKPLCGAVSLLQRYGSTLQCNPHTHSWLPDGVFYRDAQNRLQFQWAPPPEPKDIAVLLEKIRRRVLKLCDKEIPEPDENQLSLAATQAQAVESPLRHNSREPPEDSPDTPQPLCAQASGFSLHAGLFANAPDRKKLERLLRYGMRPPFSQKRLSLTPQGKVRLKLRKPYYTGDTQVLFDPLDFLRRLAALIPPKGQNQIRFFGVFAPHSKHKAALKSLVPKSGQQGLPAKHPETQSHAEPETTKRRGYKLLWADLLKRVFRQDVLACPRCNERLKLIALIQDQSAMKKICAHLGLPTELEPVSPARSPPQCEFADWE